MKVLFTLVHKLAFLLSGEKKTILEDIGAWNFNYLREDKLSLTKLLIRYPSFRSLFSYRIRREKGLPLRILITLADFFLKPQTNLYIVTKSIKGGLFLHHAFSTIVSAKSIGRNCWINQQVTIGYTSPDGAPVIKDNVRIYAGAKVLGDITVGNNVIIGANAVVVKDVPDNCTVVGVPAYIIKRDGQKVRQPL